MKKENLWPTNPSDYPFKVRTISNVIGSVLGATIAKFIKGFVYASGAIWAIKCFL